MSISAITRIMEIIRRCKILFASCFAIYFSVIVFNNLTDYNSNFGFVSNILSMNDTFSDDHNWRAIINPYLHHFAYWFIIALEMIIAVLLWFGAISMWRNRNASISLFQSSKKGVILGLTFSFCLWFLFFISIGGEWFLMWQSENWNGNPTAFRNAILAAVGLSFICRSETTSH